MFNEIIVTIDECLDRAELAHILIKTTKAEWEELSKRQEWKAVEAFLAKGDIKKMQFLKKITPETEEQKNEKTIYEDMVESLSDFVIRTANKDNPTSAEINAMVEMAKMLFRTI